MGDAKKAMALNVRLRPVDHSDQPHSANDSHVGVAQGGAATSMLASSSQCCWG